MARELVLAVALALALGACSRSGQDSHVKQDNVWQTQIDAVHKAQGIEQLQADQFEKQRRLMEDQGG